MKLIFLLSFLVMVYGRTGVDLSVATTQSTWDCLAKDYNVTYSIIRVYRNTGLVDTNAATTIKNVAAAGINDIGAYMFPCMPTSSYSLSHNITCPSPEEQVFAVVDNLFKNDISIQRTNSKHLQKVVVNRIWLDIEDEVPAKYYDANVVNNQDFLANMVKELNRLRIPIGIYTTKTYWQSIMGNINGYGALPLWYPRYDNVDSLEFFAPFADFTKVDIKQTAGDSGRCGISQVDNDYMEG